MGVKVIVLPGLPGSTLGMPATPPLPEPRYAEWIDGASPLRPLIDPNKNADIYWPPTTSAILSAFVKATPLDFERLREPKLETICPIWGYDAGNAADFLPPLRVSFYSGLVSRIREENSVEKPNVVGFGFDWRKDLIAEGEKLADFITDRMKWNKTSDKVVLVAHSTGGLVARAMIENPKLATHRALRSVKALVTMGTPHLGTTIALQAALGLDVGGFAMKPGMRRLAGDQRYPGLYQLFPFPGQPAVSEIVGNKFNSLNLYDLGTVKRLKLRAESGHVASYPAALK